MAKISYKKSVYAESYHKLRSKVEITMVLYLSLTISVALFGLTSADMLPAPLQILRAHHRTCENGQVLGIPTDCNDFKGPCSSDPDYIDPDSIQCFTPLIRKSFAREIGSPRKCLGDDQIAAYGDDFACITYENERVVACNRPVYCIWPRLHDLEKLSHSHEKTKYIETDYPVKWVVGKICKDDSQVPHFETGICNHTVFSSSCDYDYTCVRANKNVIVNVVTVKNSPPPGMKCPPGMILREVDLCGGFDRDATNCRNTWKCFNPSDIPDATFGSNRPNQARKNITGISFRT